MIWKVIVDSWHQGSSKTFWRKKKALNYANKVKNNYVFVTVENLITKEEIRIKEPDKNQIFDYRIVT